MNKTFKREIALGLFAVLFAFYLWGMWEPAAADIAESLKVPVFTFGSGAFALDAVAKQVKP